MKNTQDKERTKSTYNYALPPIMLKGTSAGKPLRRLGSLTCPYTGIKIIPGDKVNPFEKKLIECSNAVEHVNLLSNYARNMQPTEKSVFAIFRDFASENPGGNLKDCLSYLFRGCLTRLKLEEFFVLDDVDVLSKKLSPETALKLRKKQQDADKSSLQIIKKTLLSVKHF